MQGNVAFWRKRSGSKRKARTVKPYACAARAMLPAVAPSRPTPQSWRTRLSGSHLP